MSLLKKVQKRSVERKFGGTHPILRMGLDRNVIDAYFTGLVFAAVADDEKIDAEERAKLEKIGLALNLPVEDVHDIMEGMLARDGDAKVAMAEEAAGTLKSTEAIPLFLCEWSQIWESHEFKSDELNEFRSQLCEWMGCEYDEETFSAFDEVVAACAGGDAPIRKLFKKISDDHLAYLFGGEELIRKEREILAFNEKAEAEAKAASLRLQTKKLASSFCGEVDRWVDNYFARKEQDCRVLRTGVNIFVDTCEDLELEQLGILGSSQDAWSSLRSYLMDKGFTSTMAPLLFEEVDRAFKKGLPNAVLLDEGKARRFKISPEWYTISRFAFLRRSVFRLVGVGTLSRSSPPMKVLEMSKSCHSNDAHFVELLHGSFVGLWENAIAAKVASWCRIKGCANRDCEAIDVVFS